MYLRFIEAELMENFKRGSGGTSIFEYIHSAIVIRPVPAQKLREEFIDILMKNSFSKVGVWN